MKLKLNSIHYYCNIFFIFRLKKCSIFKTEYSNYNAHLNQ